MYYFRERLHRAGKFFIWYGAETKQKLVLRTEILSYPEWFCGEDSYALAEQPMTCVAIGTGKYVEFLAGKKDEEF